MLFTLRLSKGEIMKEDWKIIKLCYRCGLQKRMMTILALGFFIFGLIFEGFSLSEILMNQAADGGAEVEVVTDVSFRVNVSGFYLMLVAMYIGQVILSADVSKLVQSSPYKKAIQTKYLMTIITVISFVAYTFLVAIRVVGCSFIESPVYKTALIRDVVVVGIAGFLIILYSSMIYKYYVLSLVVVFITVFPVMFFGDRILAKLSWLDGWLAVVVGYVILILGAVLGYTLAKLFYKKDIEGVVFRNALAKAT